ncbi:MAG: hypothetical protein KF850_24300 [Labilithrix sp.]|nr:hypothetical protein [Labilithrix sp.]
MNRETCTAICQTFDRVELRSAIPDDERAEAFARALKNMGADAFEALEAAVAFERATHRPVVAPVHEE